MKASAFFETGESIVKNGSRALGFVGLGFIAVDAYTDPNGIQLHHKIDAAVGIVTFLPVVGQAVGIDWFIGI